MKKIRERTLQLLVATDVAARGLDVDDITHVINYNLSDEPERYTHRSGRTTRAGKSGISSRKLGQIDLKREFSFFDVEKCDRPIIVIFEALKGCWAFLCGIYEKI